MRFKLILFAGALAVAIGALALVSWEVMAQTEGEVVQFFLPAGTPMFDYGSAVAVVTGPSRGTTALGNCAAGDGFHIQEFVLISRGSGNAAIRVEPILLRSDPLRPGTKLINLEALGSCPGSDGIDYDRYKGTVESQPAPQTGRIETGMDGEDTPQTTCSCGRADSQLTAQAEGAQFGIAIPSSVTITIDLHRVIVTGKSADISPVSCAPGTPFPHSAVIVDQRGDGPAQHSEILIFATDAIANGTRLRITGGGTACNSELKLYTGTVE